MDDDKEIKDEKQDADSQVTFEDAKGNKIMIGGSINGFAIRNVAQYHPRIRGLDKDWKGKRVIVVLLDK